VDGTDGTTFHCPTFEVASFEAFDAGRVGWSLQLSAKAAMINGPMTFDDLRMLISLEEECGRSTLPSDHWQRVIRLYDAAQARSSRFILRDQG
jgi:hypothetical protein